MNIIWYFIDFFVNFFETVILFKYTQALFKKRYSLKTTYISICFLSILSFCLCEIGKNNIYNRILLYLIILLFINKLFLNSFIKKALAFMLLLVIDIGIENLSVFIIMFLYHQPISSFVSNTVYRLIAILLAKITLYIVVNRISTNNSRTKYDVKLRKDLIIQLFMFLFIILITMTVTLNFFENNSNKVMFVYLMALSCSILCILTLGIYESMLKYARENMEHNLTIQQKEMQYKFLNSIEISIEELRQLKHDFANHITCMNGYLYYKKYDDLKLYMDRLSEPLNYSEDVMLLEHTTMSALIYSKMQLAEKSCINMKVSTDLKELIAIEDIDLCILIGNILDNAIEGCRYSEKENKEISLSIKTKNRCILIDCINDMNEKHIIFEKNIFKTNKENKLNHGLGMKNIYSIVDKYSGKIDIDLSDERFVLHSTMLNQES